MLTLARWLRRLADWLDPPVPVVVRPVEPSVVQLRAQALTEEQDARWPERSGEAKRHQVYSRLLKDFPETPRRILARAIEDALDV